jgi:hypothetical protein
VSVLTRPVSHHALQDADGAEADRDHDAERQVEAQQRVAAKRYSDSAKAAMAPNSSTAKIETT